MLLEIMLDEKYHEGKAEGIAAGRAEGRAEGIAEGRIKSILELLEDFAPVPAELTAFISNEKDPATLQSWHKKAAKTNSLEEFMESISFSCPK